MRLWHEKLIPLLPRQQLLGQHRECAALRGNGWGKKHSTVDYVFTHKIEYLIAYHKKVIDEMERRGYKPDKTWKNPLYRGKKLGNDISISVLEVIVNYKYKKYPEHNDSYLQECLLNLEGKGIKIAI